MVEPSIDPKYSQFHLDTCAFDPKYSPEDEAANRIWELHESEVLSLVLAHSNQREIDHPNTPQWVKARAANMIFTLLVELNPQEQQKRQDIEKVLTGNAASNKHHDDAHHLFEASKYGGHFITTDKRILSKSEILDTKFSVQVLKPSDVIQRLILP